MPAMIAALHAKSSDSADSAVSFFCELLEAAYWSGMDACQA
jgi:hypothetical protein